MSVRNGRGTFDLRSVVAEETALRPVFLHPAPLEPVGTKTGSCEVKPQQGRLKFDFPSLSKESGPSGREKGLQVKKAVVKIGAAASTNTVTDKADLMRLTSMVDDLTLRLKRSSERAQAAEDQLKETHCCLLKERENATAVAKNISLERKVAQSKEASLLQEIATITKRSISKELYENAVAASVSAQSNVELLNEKVLRFEKETQEADSKLSAITEELVEMHARKSESASISEAYEQQNKQYENALLELSAAREQEKSASDELADVKRQLEEAVARAESAEMKLENAIVPEVEKKDANNDCVQGGMPFKKEQSIPSFPSTEDCDDYTSEDNETDNEDEGDCCEPKKCSVGDTVETEKTMNAVEMHAKYSLMRARLQELRTLIGSSQQPDPNHIAERDALYAEASALKARYECAFGSVAPSGKENRAPQRDTVGVFGTCLPPYKIPFGNTVAHKLSTLSPLGGAVCEGSNDCSTTTIENAKIAPTEKTDDCHNDAAHDQTADMVNAVMDDLRCFFLDAQARNAANCS